MTQRKMPEWAQEALKRSVGHRYYPLVVALIAFASTSTFAFPFFVVLGASQDSCRLIHAAHRVLFSAWRSRMTASRSGLSVTGPTGDQSRVFPDQRAGLSSRAWRYV